MSLYIKDMELPRSCEECRLSKPLSVSFVPVMGGASVFCNVLQKTVYCTGRHADCPLIDVTGKKLIDKNALSQDLLDRSFYPVIVRRAIDTAPVIGGK